MLCEAFLLLLSGTANELLAAQHNAGSDLGANAGSTLGANAGPAVGAEDLPSTLLPGETRVRSTHSNNFFDDLLSELLAFIIVPAASKTTRSRAGLTEMSTRLTSTASMTVVISLSQSGHIFFPVLAEVRRESSEDLSNAPR